MSKATSKAPSGKTYQAMLEDVEGIVRAVGAGQLDLDEVVAKIEEGYKLIKTMRTRLDATKSKVEELRAEFEKETKPDQAAGKDNQTNDNDNDSDDDMPF